MRTLDTADSVLGKELASLVAALAKSLEVGNYLKYLF